MCHGGPTALEAVLDPARILATELSAQARGVYAEVLAIATGRDPLAERDERRENGGLAEVASERAGAILNAWVDDVEEEPETAVMDALTDLIHYARSHRLDPDEVFERALRQAEAERKEDAEHRAYELEASEA